MDRQSPRQSSYKIIEYTALILDQIMNPLAAKLEWILHPEPQ